MATTVEVHTWAEFAAACCPSGTVTYPYTIKLMNDIDLNDGYATGVHQYVYSHLHSATYIFDGDDGNGGHYKIKNLRTRLTGGDIFYTDYGNPGEVTYKFQNIDFVNLILSGGHFLNMYPIGVEGRLNIVLDNCRFVGYRTGNSYLINQYDRITATSCYFDMPWYGAGSSTYDYTSLVARGTPTTNNISTANFCWFHESYGGWNISNSDEQRYVEPPQEYPTTQCCMFAMNGCYIDGEMKRGIYYWDSARSGLFYAAVYRKEIGNYYTAATPNVIDMHWSATMSSVQYTTVRVFNMSAVFKKSYNSGTFPAYEYTKVSAGSQPNIILATPEEMQDVSWLRAQGFPVIEDTPTE